MQVTEKDTELLLSAIRIARAKADEFFDELEIAVSGASKEPISEARSNRGTETRRLDVRSLRGTWVETAQESDQTYRWPDGNVDEYVQFVRYEGRGDFEGIETAIGYKENGEVIGFLITKNDKRGLVFFQKADDFNDSRELLSMVRGGGESGRAGFSPNDPPPVAYADLTLQSLRDRVKGKWNVLAVVAKADDVDSILNHVALQARLRELV